MAVTFGVSANPAFPARVAPATTSILNTNGLLGGNGQKRCADRLVAMDTDKMTTKVMFPAEGTTA
jgi:hypothetical protein